MLADHTTRRSSLTHEPSVHTPVHPQVDLILTDVLMPEVSGLELMQEVLHGELFCDVPVVVMSSVDSQESVLKAFEGGAADYLIKVREGPFRMKKLGHVGGVSLLGACMI